MNEYRWVKVNQYLYATSKKLSPNFNKCCQLCMCINVYICILAYGYLAKGAHSGTSVLITVILLIKSLEGAVKYPNCRTEHCSKACAANTTIFGHCSY